MKNIFIKGEFHLPTIKVDTTTINSYAAELETSLQKIKAIEAKYASAYQNLDWEIRAEADIDHRLTTIHNDLLNQIKAIEEFIQFFELAAKEYDAVENKNKNLVYNESLGTYVEGASVSDDYSDFVNQLIEEGIITTKDDISTTDDGFLMVNVSLEDILKKNNIEKIDGYDENGEKRQYENSELDDWYIYCIKNEDGFTHSILKLREAEDNNTIVGAAIPFMKFDTDKFQAFVKNGKGEKKLYTHLHNLIHGENEKHSESIKNYFEKNESKAPYLIADKYVEKIVKSADGNKIPFSKAYYGQIENANRLEHHIQKTKKEAHYRGVHHDIRDYNKYITDNLRVYNYGQEINKKAGKIIVDTDGINIADPNNLTKYEKQAILSAYTSNPNYNSFAAEVVYHAAAINYCKPTPKILYYQSPVAESLTDLAKEYVYRRAIKSDMAVGEEYVSGVTDKYYDLNDSSVKIQAEIHGER